MTDDEQRIAIAEACGWLDKPKCKPSLEQLEAILEDKRPLKVEILPDGQVRAVPDYLNDLNAIQSAVLSQSPDFRRRFSTALSYLSSETGNLFCELTAQDWAKTFLTIQRG